MSIVVSKDLRTQFGPARDQDPRPTCMAFAASDAHAGARAGWEPLSVEWAYYHALKRDGIQPHQGVHLATMLATLRGDGQPVEACWPYVAELFTDIAAWKPPAGADPIFRRESETAPATGLCCNLRSERAKGDVGIGDLIRLLGDGAAR